MATSSAVLHSFLRDALNENKKLDELRAQDLLEYNRTACGLIRMPTDPTKCDFDDIADFLIENNALPDTDAVIFYKGRLFHADNKKRRVTKIEPTDKNKKEFEYLIKNFPKFYQRAKGSNLKLVISITHRAYSENRSDDFLSPINFYLEILENTDTVMCSYMDEKKRDQLRFDLKITLLLLVAQQQHEIENQKFEKRKIYDKLVRKCLGLLVALEPEYQKQIAQSPEQAMFTDGKPVKYLGISLGHELGKELIHWTDRKSKTIKELMGALNDERLSWVWGSTFLKTAIDQVPTDYQFAQQAFGAIRMPDPYTGCLSWVLYYCRFALNLFLLLKHTIKGFWMSDEEAKTPWNERFLTQWSQRKFTLLNDSIWGTANLLCYFWLTGKSILGTWGDAVTVGLLIFDISVALWDFEEQKTQYNKAMQQFNATIDQLNEDLKRIDISEHEDKKQVKRRQIEMQIYDLEREKAKCQREWQMQKLSLIINISYAVALLLAFFILTMPFIPLSAPVAATCIIVGAVLCLAFTIINNAIKGGIEAYKTHQNVKESLAEYEMKVALLRDEASLTEPERKLLFLEIKKLKAETEYQKQVFNHQMGKLILEAILDMLVPALIFVSILFFPLGIGLAVLGASLGLAIALHVLVDKSLKPQEKTDEIPFDQSEYIDFCESIPSPKAIENKRGAPTRNIFFNKKLGKEDEWSDEIELEVFPK